MGIEVVEGNRLALLCTLCVGSIPPKKRGANVVGPLKGKAAIRMHRDILGGHGTSWDCISGPGDTV